MKFCTLCWKLNTTHKLKNRKCIRLFSSGLGWAAAHLGTATLGQRPKFSPGSSGRFLNPTASNSLHWVGGAEEAAGRHMEHTAPTAPEAHPALFEARMKRTERVHYLLLYNSHSHCSLSHGAGLPRKQKDEGCFQATYTAMCVVNM